MTEAGHADVPAGDYQVAVAIAPAGGFSLGRSDEAGGDAGARPGFDETSGRHSGGRHMAGVAPVLARGDAAAKLATEAIARQIGLAAQRIAEAIDAQVIAAPTASNLALESVEVSFGITLTAGIEALFTAKSESSAEVTIILSRRSPELGTAQ